MKKDGRYTCEPFEFAIASLDEVFVFHLGIVNFQDTFAIGLLIEENSIVALKEKKGKKVIKAIQKLQVEALLRAQ